MGSPDNNGLETLERFAESALTYDGGMVPPLDCGGLPEELRPLGCRLNELADVLGAAIDRELRVTRAALTDALTGAGNRACFNQDVDVLWDAGSRFCIAFIDLDNLKACNDRCGGTPQGTALYRPRPTTSATACALTRARSSIAWAATSSSSSLPSAPPTSSATASRRCARASWPTSRAPTAHWPSRSATAAP